MSELGSAGLANPFDSKVSFDIAVSQADDFVDIGLSLHSAQFGAVTTNVDREYLLREDLPCTVRTKNSDRHSDFFSRLTAFAHDTQAPGDTCLAT